MPKWILIPALTLTAGGVNSETLRSHGNPLVGGHVLLDVTISDSDDPTHMMLAFSPSSISYANSMGSVDIVFRNTIGEGDGTYGVEFKYEKQIDCPDRRVRSTNILIVEYLETTEAHIRRDDVSEWRPLDPEGLVDQVYHLICRGDSAAEIVDLNWFMHTVLVDELIPALVSPFEIFYPIEFDGIESDGVTLTNLGTYLANNNPAFHHLLD